MTIHRIYDSYIGKSVAFGLVPVTEPAAPPVVALGKYLKGATPSPTVAPPHRPDWAFRAWTGLKNIDGNDDTGDCCFAGIMHMICIQIAALGLNLPFPTRREAWALYSAVTGFNPNAPLDKDGNNPTDVGGDLQTTIRYCMAHGALKGGLFKPIGFVSVDASNPIELKTALWRFGSLYCGLFLPSTGGPKGGGYTRPMPQGDKFSWGVAGPPDPKQGHCIIKYGANDFGTFDDTWGLFGSMSYPANAKYLTPAGNGECYAILWDTWASGAHLAPNAISEADLERDINAQRIAA